MGQTNLLIVTTQDGSRGTIAQDIRTGDSRVMIDFDNGQHIYVPRDVLVQKSDGTYSLPMIMNDLQQYIRDEGTAERMVLPVVAEEAQIEKRVLTNVVRVTKQVNEREEVIDEPLLHEEVNIERVPVNKVVESPSAVRYEGETMVVPVYEEVLVVEKRLMLKEELRITKVQNTQSHIESVKLREEEIIVERPEDKRVSGLTAD
jgi:uncharacterized protein (TIGR02271 family)